MRRGLGKGLSQLIAEQYDPGEGQVAIDQITPNQRQPRRFFSESALEELTESIRTHGIIQPLLVRPVAENRYELIAGERRWRAAQRAGLKSVPVTIRSAAAQDSLELAIIENVQREDINAVESALAYRRLIEEFGLTQEQVATRVGKNRTTVANTLRLLKLPAVILDGLEANAISEGHARALLAAPADRREALYTRIVDEDLTVRDIERLTKQTPKEAPTAKTAPKDADLEAVERVLAEYLGTPVAIDGRQIRISYFGPDDLNRLLDRMGTLDQ